MPPPTRRQMVYEREEGYIYNNFSLFAHFLTKPSVGISVGNLSAVPTDEGFV